MNEELQNAIGVMTQRIADILALNTPSIYLYGSVALHDFKLGWSDIDILVLTEKQMTEEQAQQLVWLRQTILEEEPGNPL